MNLHQTKEILNADNADLSRSSFRNANLSETQFTEMTMTGVSFNDANLGGAHFNNVNWPPLNLPKLISQAAQ